MSLYDWFFPQQSQRNTTHQQMATRSRRERTRRAWASNELEGRITELEENLGFVTLVLGAMLEKLDKQGVISRDDLHNVMSELDALDGMLDGRLNVNLFRDNHAQQEVLHIIDPDSPPPRRKKNKPPDETETIDAILVDPIGPTDTSSPPETTENVDRLQSYLEELRKRRTREGEDADKS